MCSTRSEQQPTVSASSDPFSFPTRKANLSIKYMATARCATCASVDLKSFVYEARIRSMCSFSFRDF